ncbi:GNAT family N-acetyltransferase [Pleomorphomonas diazotrophica]|uniref:GNAT family N-acetyltransferase n=1 Tax=Pleomorphomonas diazotrophica TaxID=1166257 RepID=A0A1I4VV92_9HYPH|nr:N-acetyltransferase [Pleomorphomonas diazotrophica]PKR89259.1 GNAT family N-acetyltransferase [Pleomorphomonas diazotrophica]SFN05135.1 Predicted N-acetyltransferase YhbS [Pleomorphomonas diazotrophica]
MIAYMNEQAGDVFAREMLLDRAFGPARFRKSSEKIRSGRLPSEGLALVARDGDRLVGSVRLWEAAAGRMPLLLLGPLAVDDDCRGAGIGAALMRLALEKARALGHGAVVLVGDEPYYRRFGFSTDGMERLAMPGPFERARFLGLELVPGALKGAEGVLRPTGRLAPVHPATVAA